MRRLALVTCLVVVGITGTACSSEPHVPGSGSAVDRLAGAASGAEFVTAMRQVTSYEYEPYPGPRAMLRDVEHAVVGTVESMETAVVANELEGQGALVIGLRPDEVWKRGQAEDGGLVHFSVPRPRNVGVEYYREALPVGTRIVLFGIVHPPETTFSRGGPGAVTYVPVPQGLFVTGRADELHNVWAEDSVDPSWAGTSDLEGLRRAVGRQ